MREDVEQPPKFAVLDGLGCFAKIVLSPFARLYQVVEYGNHFTVIHLNPPSLVVAIAIPLERSGYATGG
jgi:hypothetical protein